MCDNKKIVLNPDDVFYFQLAPGLAIVKDWPIEVEVVNGNFRLSRVIHPEPV